jgi:hypothetical protein
VDAEETSPRRVIAACEECGVEIATDSSVLGSKSPATTSY